MRIRQLTRIILCLLVITPTMMYAQSYDKLWKQVEEAQKKDLPQTVAGLTDQIFRKAQKEKRSAQMLKAYLTGMQFRRAVTPDSFYVDLRGLEQWTKEATLPLDRMILHTLLASLYTDFANENRWQILQDEQMGEAPGTDLRTWNIYVLTDTVLSHVRQAFEDGELLLNTSSKRYEPFVVQGESSLIYHHDMYHLLMLRNLDTLKRLGTIFRNEPRQKIIDQHLADLLDELTDTYRSRNNREGVLLAEVWRIGYMEENTSVDQEKLSRLAQEYRDTPWGIEVWIAWAQYVSNQGQTEEMLRIAREGIAAYPDHPRAALLRKMVADAVQPYLMTNLPELIYSDTELPIEVNYRNLRELTVELYPLSLLSGGEPIVAFRVPTKEQLETYLQQTPESQTFSLNPTSEYAGTIDTLRLKVPSLGAYAIRMVHPNMKEEASSSILYVSNLRVVTQGLPDGRTEVVVLDARTGCPVRGADVLVYGRQQEESKPLDSFRTDSIGRVAFQWKEAYSRLTALKGADRFLPLMNSWAGSYNANQYYPEFLQNESYHQLSVLTDRSLYRPGQTVFVKGILYAQLSDTAQVVSGNTQEITLESMDRRWSESRQVTTNSYGSFTAAFVLPADLSPGTYTLGGRRGRVQIQVEEYKRPTFNLFFDPLEGSYQLGDSIQVSGTARTFSGIGLSGQPVRYTVTRALQWGLHSVRGGGETIASGEVMPDSQGHFSVPVHLQTVDNIPQLRGFYLYEIKATFTSPSGETQEARTSVRAGDRSLILSAEIPDHIQKDQPLMVKIEATNLSGKPVAASGRYALYPALIQPKESFARPVADTPEANRSRYAQEFALSGTFTANQESRIEGWEYLSSGRYLLVFTAPDQQGREVTLEKEILLFSVSDRRPPVSLPIWYVPLQTEFGPSETASFLLGTSLQDACFILDVFSGGERVEIRHLVMSESVMRFDYPYQDSYGNGVTLSFMMMHDGQFYEQQVNLTKRMQPKNLELRWETFRDKLRPGQEESWKLTIHDPAGKPADAEMLALMYDASLDKIRPYNQQLQVYYQLSAPYFSRSMPRSGNLYFNLNFPYQKFNWPELVFDGFLSPYIFSEYSANSGLMNTPAILTSRAQSGVEVRVRGMSTITTEVYRDAANYATDVVFEEELIADADAGGGLPPATTDLRTNFNETAFFYPQLQTNAKGEIVFTFTLPESLTSWNFRGFAHTRDMLTGMLSGSTVASKEFMVMTNLPRFVRVGDETAFAATLANQTDNAQSGTVTFVLFDPVTEKVIHTEKQSFFVGAGENTGVDFRFTATADHDLLGCRIVAENSKFSDGEQHLLPVLPNRETVTETVPMPIRGGETREFALDSLFNANSPTATDRRLTVEFSGNPAWYAIQALPALSNPEEENAISLAAAWYANSVASYILDRYPRMRQILESWKLTGKESFLSNLQKNEELKNILLSETPWLLEAHTEQQQMERLSTLFDLNQIRYNNGQLLSRLRQLQTSDGSWAWYKGMSSSTYITLEVMENFIRRKTLTGNEYEPEVAQMLAGGWRFLHAQALEMYTSNLGEDGMLSPSVLSSFAMQYLYLIAISGEEVPASNQQAYQQMLDLLPQQITRQGVIDKARSAIALQGAGRQQEARAFTNSLGEYLVRTDTRGAYFAFNESRGSWWGQPVPAHVITMEAIDRVTGDTALLEEMKIWLLGQKQTRQWRTPVATVNAVFALLYRGQNPLDNEGDVRITLGGQTLRTSPEGDRPALPAAYIKESFTDPAQIALMKEAVVEKKDPGIGWGAVYAQYQEDISKINRHGEELQVEKRLYIERYEGSERKLIALSVQTPLQVGDRVVCRLTLRVDRPMDFVQLTDQRAACFEPVNTLSGYTRSNQTSYFISVRDASTRFFFDTLGKGVYTIEHTYLVNRAGTYESGLATLQSAYAPEFAAHAPSVKVVVEK